MRPVERGPRPKDANGNDIVFTTYSNARSALIGRMGQYCSYCNQKLPASLAVEHVQPKDPVPALALEWTNFLLGCTNCNSSKGATPIDAEEYLWPDIHNTHLAFQYNQDGTIEVHPSLTNPKIIRRAQNTLNLVGLQKYTDSMSASDRRWKNRKDAYQKATQALSLLEEAIQKGAGDEASTLVGLWAPDSGFFSIWFAIFDQHPKVKEALRKNFPGTASDAFDNNGAPRRRTTIL